MGRWAQRAVRGGGSPPLLEIISAHKDGGTQITVRTTLFNDGNADGQLYVRSNPSGETINAGDGPTPNGATFEFAHAVDADTSITIVAPSLAWRVGQNIPYT